MRGFCCKESVVEFPKWSGLHSLSSRTHPQKLLESVCHGPGLNWLESHTHPSLLSLLTVPTPELIPLDVMGYSHGAVQRHSFSINRGRGRIFTLLVDVLMGRCSSTIVCAWDSMPIGLMTILLGNSMYVRLIQFRHTHVSSLPLFIFTQPDIRISHKLPQKLWSEAERNNAW